jgi:hypothetical protein
MEKMFMKDSSTTAKEKSESQEYLEIFKHWQLWIFGLIIPFLLEGTLLIRNCLFGGESISNAIQKINVFSTGLLYILSVLASSIPLYCIEKFRLIKNEINNQMNKLEKCPIMLALHTDDEVLENKLELIKKSTEHKWLLSKLLSKMIAINCKDFSFYISSISEFTKFTSTLATMGTKDIKSYTSIPAFTWLNSFANKDNPTNKKKIKFYNNLEQEFPLDKTLLDKHLITSNEINTKRYVFLSQFEWDNKYLSERYLDTYYKINKIDGKKNKDNICFIDNDNDNYDWSEYKKIENEYVIYDDTILLSYNNDNHLLSYISDEKKFSDIKSILEKCTKEEYCLSYYELKEKIIEQKILILGKIVNNPRKPKISHTLSFLFRGSEFWQEYQKKEKGFNDYSRRALNDGLKSFLGEDEKFCYKDTKKYKIVEIGPGDGSKTRLILNTLGTENIHEYHLIDVNEIFLNKAEKILEKFKEEHDEFFKHKIHLLDICDHKKGTSYKYIDGDEEKRIDEIFRDSVVIIATNSSVFYEDGFSLDIFSECKAILLTIQVLSGEEKEKKYIKTKYSTSQRLNLLIHPLRAFNIPIEDTIAKDYLIAEYQNDKLEINFRLKNYLSALKQKGIEMNIKNSKDLSCYTEKYQRYYESYKTLLGEFTSREEITIYETLKFEDKCGGKMECEDCEQDCNIRKSSCFKGFDVKCGLTKDYKGVSKYAFVLLTKNTND